MLLDQIQAIEISLNHLFFYDEFQHARIDGDK
ncbi:hypothetical protein CA11_51130 [Gimesia maris]|nr:hypothetical protein CA11_51130 [Gimesia maris]